MGDAINALPGGAGQAYPPHPQKIEGEVVSSGRLVLGSLSDAQGMGMGSFFRPTENGFPATINHLKNIIF
ncbi:MAG: hypothetical protein FWD79_02020 [Desulfobulbus sp.]|nr:hypothetical protein [Desulfobulbus sp.]